LAIVGNNYTFSSLFSVKNLVRSYQIIVKIMEGRFVNFVPKNLLKIFEVFFWAKKKKPALYQKFHKNL
jgi:hypothetical protein